MTVAEEVVLGLQMLKIELHDEVANNDKIDCSEITLVSNTFGHPPDHVRVAACPIEDKVEHILLAASTKRHERIRFFMNISLCVQYV
jgi:hypothetical protein